MEYKATDNAPRPLGKYSQVSIARNGMVHTAGQIGIGLDGKLAGETIAEQTNQALQNVQAVLEEAGVEFPDGVADVIVHLADFDHFTDFDAAYGAYMGEPYPPRTTVASGLPSGVLVEIKMVAELPE